MAKKTKKTPVELPQLPYTWFVAIRRLRTWVTKKSKPIRPYLTIIVNLEEGLILDSQIEAEPDPHKVQKLLFNAMLRPMKELEMEPHRPDRIFFEDRELMQALAPALQEIGIETRYRPQRQLDDLVKDLEANLRGEQPEIPGLLSQRKVNPKMVAGLFGAAADFYRAAPWVLLKNEDVLSILVPPQKNPYFAIVMGQGGVEYGLALYKRWEDIERQYLPHDDPDDIIPPDGLHTFFFNPITEVPFNDLDAIEKYGWEVADQEAYPVPLIFLSAENVQRPDRDEILWYEASLRAIPLFVREHLTKSPDGEIQPVEANIPVTISSGKVIVRVKVPAGTLPQTRQPSFREPAVEGELAFPFDRRAMEGDMARMFGMFSDEIADPKLEKAQGIMYEAWDERNPAKRITLAQKALKISKNCADAYVLLAEEKASNLQEAFDYYQEGIQAGQRALGEVYFEENTGHFWGLLETRPYMRAMEGAASCLWQLGRKEEALQTYSEMLRLNPGDNQGIRYALVDLLLGLNRESDLEKLLKEYEGDWTAVWLYTQALLAYQKRGDSEKARRALQEALEQNRFVPEYLTGKKRVPNRMPDYIGMGEDTEAADYAANHLNYWRQTSGAIEWLKKELSALPPAKAGKATRTEKKGRTGGSDSSFQIGDSVVVNPGTIDPDFGTDLGGWQGRIIKVMESKEGPLLAIEWDSQTLENMPLEMI